MHNEGGPGGQVFFHLPCFVQGARGLLQAVTTGSSARAEQRISSTPSNVFIKGLNKAPAL